MSVERSETHRWHQTVLRSDADLLLIGDERAEERFVERYVAHDRSRFTKKPARLIDR